MKHTLCRSKIQNYDIFNTFISIYRNFNRDILQQHKVLQIHDCQITVKSSVCNVEIIQNVRNISYKQNDIYIHKYICMLLNIVNTFRLTQYLITYNFEKVSQGILFS